MLFKSMYFIYTRIICIQKTCAYKQAFAVFILVFINIIISKNPTKGKIFSGWANRLMKLLPWSHDKPFYKYLYLISINGFFENKIFLIIKYYLVILLIQNKYLPTILSSLYEKLFIIRSISSYVSSAECSFLRFDKPNKITRFKKFWSILIYASPRNSSLVIGHFQPSATRQIEWDFLRTSGNLKFHIRQTLLLFSIMLYY